MHRRTDGFTLVELMVVVLVIGILVAVAVPVFKAAKTKAEMNTCQANQRTWAGVVQQVKADGAEPAAATAGYVQLASGSLWYTKANGPYLKSIPKCPSAGGTSYWVYEAAVGTAGNGAMAGCAASATHTLQSTALGAHRYWRIMALAPSWRPDNGGYLTEYYQLSLYCSPDGTGTDLALKRSADASSLYGGYTKDLANDGNDATVWHSALLLTVPQWWSVDLGEGAAAEVHSLRYKTQVLNGAAVPQRAALEYSDDGVTWTTQIEFTTKQFLVTDVVPNL